ALVPSGALAVTSTFVVPPVPANPLETDTSRIRNSPAQSPLVDPRIHTLIRLISLRPSQSDRSNEIFCSAPPASRRATPSAIFAPEYTFILAYRAPTPATSGTASRVVSIGLSVASILVANSTSVPRHSLDSAPQLTSRSASPASPELALSYTRQPSVPSSKVLIGGDWNGRPSVDAPTAVGIFRCASASGSNPGTSSDQLLIPMTFRRGSVTSRERSV